MEEPLNTPANNNFADTNSNQSCNQQSPNNNQMPDNHLVWAILTTILCCLPLGIVAIVKASKVETLWFNGHYTEAQKNADDAKKYSRIGIGIGVAYWVVCILAYIIIFAMAYNGYLD